MPLPDASRPRTYVMGVVNVTPDSFSSDGTPGTDAAVDRARQLVDEGADLLDVGGESTRPGAGPVSAAEERRRVVPVIERLAGRLGVPVSVDTSRAVVAEAALAAGAALVNDVRALAADPALAEVIARAGAGVVLVHNSRGRPPLPQAVDLVEVVGRGLEDRLAYAVAAGIARERIMIDPGFGFGKRGPQSLPLLRRLGELTRRPALAGLKVLVGTSRKGITGAAGDLPPPERLEETLVTLVVAIQQGADIVRVHDVAAAVRTCRAADAVLRAS